MFGVVVGDDDGDGGGDNGNSSLGNITSCVCGVVYACDKSDLNKRL